MLSEELSSTQPLKYKPQQTKSGLGSFLFFCLYSCLLLSLFPPQDNRTGLFSTSWAPEVPFLPPPLLPVPKSLLPSPTICPPGPAGALLALGLARPGHLPLTCAEPPAPPQVLLSSAAASPTELLGALARGKSYTSRWSFGTSASGEPSVLPEG